MMHPYQPQQPQHHPQYAAYAAPQPASYYVAPQQQSPAYAHPAGSVVYASDAHQHQHQQQQHQLMYGQPSHMAASAPVYVTQQPAPPMAAMAVEIPQHQPPQPHQRGPSASAAAASAAASSAAGQSAPAVVAAVPVGDPVPSASGSGVKRPRGPRVAPGSAGRSGGAGGGGGGGPGEPPIEQGPGIALGDIPLLTKRFEKVSNEDPRTKLLYAVCFPTSAGAIPERAAKRALRHFNGWASAESRAQASARLQEYLPDSDLLRKVARLLDLSAEGTALVLVERIESYLAAPSIVAPLRRSKDTSEQADATAAATMAADGSLFPDGSVPLKKKRRKPGEKKEKLLKRPPNPYQFFASAKREEVTRAQPDLQMMEVNRILGQMWSAVPVEQRAPYVEAAARARAEWERNGGRAAAAAAGGPGGSGGGKRRKVAEGYAVDDDFDFDDSDAEQSESAAAAVGSNGSAAVAPSPAPVLDLEVAAQLQLAVARMHLSTSAELESLTLRSIKQTLAAQFGEKVVAQYQALIGYIVDAELAKP